MDRKRRLLGCLACLICFACSPAVNPKEASAGKAPSGPAPQLCGEVCERWRGMACEEGEKVCDKYEEPSMVCKVWISCEQWCEGVENAKSQPLNLQCLATAPASSCQALEDACAY